MNRRGFSLIEIIGVIAIMAIMATAIAPVAIRGAKKARSNAERQSLKSISLAITETIKDSLYIPSESNWSTYTAKNLEMPSSKIDTVLQGTRRFLIQSNLTIPYNQDSLFSSGTGDIGDLTATEPRLRYMILSNIEKPLSNATIDSSNFDKIWSQSSGALFDEDNEAVTIERSSFPNGFSRIILNTSGVFVPGDGSWDIGRTSTIRDLTGISPIELWIINGTILDLYKKVSGTQTLVGSLVVDKSINLTFSSVNGWSW